jgi:hypothetical protein
LDYTEFVEFATSAGFRDTSADPKAPQKFGALNLLALFEVGMGPEEPYRVQHGPLELRV